MSLDRLIRAIAKTQNPTVVGLDPSLDHIPAHIKDSFLAEFEDPLEGAAEAFIEFNKAIIDAVCDIVPSVKPQAAYYEALGWQGMRALYETISYAREKGLFVIVDGKRNDIGSTMSAYARAHLGIQEIAGKRKAPFGGDALTVNGYLGTDGIAPLVTEMEAGDKGIFVLVKTSNPSSVELQDCRLEDGRTVYEAMGEMCEKWGSTCMGEYGYSGVGAVVGATWPEQLAKLRLTLPHTFFLVPGYGAQGGDASSVAGAFDRCGMGAVVNSSRAILTAWKKEKCDERDFAGAARREALRMRDAIRGVLPEICLPH